MIARDTQDQIDKLVKIEVELVNLFFSVNEESRVKMFQNSVKSFSGFLAQDENYTPQLNVFITQGMQV